MCHDHDSRPPIAPIAGGALESGERIVEAADGNRFRAFHATAASPSGAAITILPDVRGLHPFYEELALRFAENGVDALAIDWFGRTAGTSRHDADFDARAHLQDLTWEGMRSDIIAGIEATRAGTATPVSTFTIGFCMGGRASFVAATLGADLAGVIGFYGPLTGPGRGGAPAPVEVAGQIVAPVLGLFGGADESIPPVATEAFDVGLSAAGVDHRLIRYPGAPHSFFDRKADEFTDASREAWSEVLAFIRSRTAAPTVS
jgi:carboxymethylenebutenolidase